MAKTLNDIRRAVLVYQGGIANVFEVDSFNLGDYGRDAKRRFQGDFYGAECFARGMGADGCIVMTAACNQAGDITRSTWSEVLEEQPFSDKFRPVKLNTSLGEQIRLVGMPTEKVNKP